MVCNCTKELVVCPNSLRDGNCDIFVSISLRSNVSLSINVSLGATEFVFAGELAPVGVDNVLSSVPIQGGKVQVYRLTTAAQLKTVRAVLSADPSSTLQIGPYMATSRCSAYGAYAQTYANQDAFINYDEFAWCGDDLASSWTNKSPLYISVGPSSAVPSWTGTFNLKASFSAQETLVDNMEIGQSYAAGLLPGTTKIVELQVGSMSFPSTLHPLSHSLSFCVPG